MAVDQRLHLLQTSLVFGRIIGCTLHYVHGDITHVQGRRNERVGYSVAGCQEVMTTGRHRAEFTVTNSGAISVGIIRPMHDYPGRKMRHMEYRVFCKGQMSKGAPGYVEGSVHQWYYYDDRVHLRKGDVVGMLLDLDAGTVTAYKNGECLGVQKRRGIAGHYCWAVTMDNHGSNRPSVRIRRA